MAALDISGVWTYRAFLNDPDIAKPFDDLRFATARLELAVTGDAVKGELSGEGWGTWIDWRLELTGAIEGDAFTLRGENTIEDELWVYDYAGRAAPSWPHALAPRPVLTGSVIRTAERARRESLAGVHATFIAVKR